MSDRDALLAEVLSEFARTMVTDFPIQAILDRLVERIVDVLPITSAGVTLISAGREPHYVAASNDAALSYERLQSDLGEGPCTTAYVTGEAVLIADVAHDTEFPVFAPQARALGLVAVFTFPLRIEGGCLGALDLYRESAGSLDAHDMIVAQTLADVVATYVANAQARDDLRQSSDLFRASSLHDSLTGLPNRALLHQRLEHATMRARRSHNPLAILFVDLDRFKQVNDIYGHRAGDELLVAVAQRLRGLVRVGDTVARMAGDEFVVLCEDLDDAANVDLLAARVVGALGEPFVLVDAVVSVSASVGIAFAGPGETLPEEVLNDADEAMYQAKRAGGDRHQLIDLRKRSSSTQRLHLERDLRRAVGRGELRLDYQPIVRTVDARIAEIEALLRWDHPQSGVIGPAVFIPLAERSDAIVEIGRWALERACADATLMRSVGEHRDLRISVNVSPRQLLSRGYCETVSDVLTATDTDPTLLILEMTESAFIHDSARAALVLADLKDLGVSVALDDFGTGYSSLMYLQRFPIDIVKIDRVFAARLAPHNPTSAIVKAIIELAHALGKSVVAEGVETAAQRDQLAALGCEHCQGYFFDRPMTIGDLTHQLRTA